MSPIGDLAALDHLDEMVRVGFGAFLRNRFIELTDHEIVEWKEEIGATELTFTLEKLFGFATTILAPKKARRQKGDQDGRRIDRVFDPKLPLLPHADIARVLEESEGILAELVDLVRQQLAEVRDALSVFGLFTLT